MINNSTSSLDTKTGYNSVDSPKKPVTSPAPTAEAAAAPAVVDSKPQAAVATSSAESDPVAEDQTQLKKQEELRKRVTEAIPKVIESLNKNQNRLDFKVAENSKRVIITVIDKETDKVIRQIPPEDLLRIADTIDQGQKPSLGGLIIDSKA